MKEQHNTFSLWNGSNMVHLHGSRWVASSNYFDPKTVLDIVKTGPMSIHSAFWKESLINRLSKLINRNRSAAKMSQVLCSSGNRNGESCQN